MTTAFAELAFTPAVLALQERYGSRDAYAPLLDSSADPGNRIGQKEAAYIKAGDGFYQSTVSETGWPYVQFKGGPRGFLKVINESTIAYADFSGNRQYISAGNLSQNNRVAIILTDYVNSRRLKIWGTAKLVDIAEAPELVEQLLDTSYHASPERAVVISIDAMSWNCPQHLPQRFTLENLEEQLAPMRKEITQLRAENEQLKSRFSKTNAK